MRSENLYESQEQLLGGLIQQLKEIRLICRPFTNIPRENQDIIDECNKFLSMLRDSEDITMLWNKKLQMSLFDILRLQAFPEVSKILIIWMFDLAAELWQKTVRDKRVQWVVANVAEAAKTWVEMREDKYWLALEEFWNKYYWDNLEWKDWIWGTEILEEDGCLVIYFQGSPKVYFPIILREELQSKSWVSIMSFNWMEHSLITSTDFSFVLRWLDDIWITSKAAQADFFKNVFWLEDWIYLCKDSQSGDVECNAFNLSDRWVDHCAVWKWIQSLNYRALTR